MTFTYNTITAPWCGHCKSIAPVWDELAEMTEDKFHVGKVDATVEKKVAEDFLIQGSVIWKLLGHNAGR